MQTKGPPVDLNLLQVLDAAVQAGSVTGAAARLGISVGAASHAIGRLREQMRDPVMVRAGKTMALTPRAESLRNRVQLLLREAHGVLSAERSFEPSGLDRRFVVRATDAFFTLVASALERIVRAEAPRVVLQVLPTASDDVDALRRGNVDAAVGRYGVLPPELRVRTLLTEGFTCLVRRDHPTVEARLTLKQYLALEHVQVAPLGQPGSHIDHVLTRRGKSRRIARVVPYLLSAMQLVAISDYVLTASAMLAQQLAGPFGLRGLPPPLRLRPFAVSVLWHPRLEGDPAHAWLRGCLVRAAREVAPARLPDARMRLSDDTVP
jgi:DNA-binding transcriptional LysR family regulator